jgi:ceramide glucosyltransferase
VRRPVRALVGGVLLLMLARLALSARYLERRAALESGAPADGAEPSVTVLQPILSGDPALPSCLLANLRAHPQARFVWLVDEDDAEGRAWAERAAAGAAHVAVVVGPPPRQGENPKLAKLARALPGVATHWVAVLDDDTRLPPGALRRAAGALDGGGVACGLPIYAPGPGPWSRLVAGFVNGSSLITYPAAAQLGQARTLNGMFYMTRAEELRGLGGFEAILGELTDDYALASLYLRAGRPLVQTAVVHPITTTVAGGRAYLAQMRRWMVFANRYVRENRSLFTLGLIGFPTLAPAPLLVASLLLRDGPALAALVGGLAVKGIGVARLRRRYGGARTTLADAVWEMAADLLTPLHVIAACMRPDRITWRGRQMRLEGGSITYG